MQQTLYLLRRSGHLVFLLLPQLQFCVIKERMIMRWLHTECVPKEFLPLR